MKGIWSTYKQAINKYNTIVKGMAIPKESKNLTWYKCGPPTYLREEEKVRWESKLDTIINERFRTILLPRQIETIQEAKTKLREEIKGRLKTQPGIQVFGEILNRVIKEKGKIEEVFELLPLPPPFVNKVESRRDYRYEEIGTLRRGDKGITIDDVRNIEESLDSKNVFKVLAYAIYNTTKCYKLINRCVYKFMEIYENVERQNFILFKGKGVNGQFRWIKSWYILKKFIQNRDIPITTYELNIIARLYDTQIRIFQEQTTQIGSMYKCIWQSCFCRDRTINLLESPCDKWALLSGRNQQAKGKSVQVTNSIQQRASVTSSVSSDMSFQSVTQIENSEKEDLEEKTIDKDEDNLFFSFNSVASVVDKETENDTTSIDSPVIDIEEESVDLSIESVLLDPQVINRHINLENRQQKDKAKVNRRNLWQKERKLIRIRKRNEQRKEKRKENNSRKLKVASLAVFDYTTEKLKEHEIALLSKGETFCIVNDKIDEDTLKVDIYNYCRRLRLHDLFREQKLESEKIEHTQNTLQMQRSRGDSTQSVTRLVTRNNQHITQNSRIINTPSVRRIVTNNSQYRSGIQPKSIGVIGRNSQQRNLTQPKSIAVRRIRRVSNLSTPVNGNTQSRNNRIINNRSQQETKKQELVLNRKLPSTFDIDSTNRNLVRYNNCIQEESSLVVKNKVPYKDNISKVEREAVKSLLEKINNNKIVITKADKGSGIVALDYDIYIRKGTKYIEEEAKAYINTQLSEEQIITNIVKSRNKIVKQLKDKNIISKETATYCIKQIEEKVTGIKFYYKIHKDSNIHTMPLRPLQSCIGAPTHHLSIVLTDILQPLLSVKNIPTFIQDTNQLLLRLQQIPKLRHTDTLISSDVAALYPSIPHEAGLVAVEQFLEKATQFSKEQITVIKLALKLVITQNFMRWNDKIYQQIRGVAMGTPVAVAYANIFMHWVDEKLKAKATYIIEHIRYIDDNLFILPTEKLEDLMQIANNILQPHIKYTYESLNNTIGLPFLDTQLFISQENSIESRLYTKKTDKHTYLLPYSFHPPHITKNIPAAVFSRIRRICSKDEYYSIDAAKALVWLEDRGYNKLEIIKAKEKIFKKDRVQMIDRIEQKRNKNLIEPQQEKFHILFIVTYSNRTTRIKEVLKSRQNILDSSFKHTRVVPRLIYRRQKNISDLFIQKSLRKPITNKETGVIVKCGEIEQHRVPCPCRGTHDQYICRCCAHIELNPRVITKLYKQVSCNSKNVIYIIGCKQCNKSYVGETQQRLKDRLLQHLNNVYKLNQPLYLHFRLLHKPMDLTISVLETVRRPEPFFRKVREAWWINSLQTLESGGFNVKLDCNQIYTTNSNTTT